MKSLLNKAWLLLKLMPTDGKNLLKALDKYVTEATYRRRFDKNHRYIRFVDIRNLTSLNETISNYTYLDGTSTIIDLALIKSLCRNIKNCDYLEIGSWRGESLFNVAEVCRSCTSISLSKEGMLSAGMTESQIKTRNIFSTGLKNIEHIDANSATFDYNLLDRKYDVIFIDGDHRYDGVKLDAKNALSLLKDENSIIIFHDCGSSFENIRHEVVTAILDGLGPEESNYFYRVRNTLCGIYTRNQLSHYNAADLTRIDKTFKLTIITEEFNQPK